jgi:vanillate O-demethylase monooxygenase subunit
VLEQVLTGEPDGYQELSINIDTGGLAARRIIARLAAEGEGISAPATAAGAASAGATR